MSHRGTGVAPGGQDVSGQVHSGSRERTFRGSRAFRGGERLAGAARLVGAAARVPASPAH